MQSDLPSQVEFDPGRLTTAETSNTTSVFGKIFSPHVPAFRNVPSTQSVYHFHESLEPEFGFNKRLRETDPSQHSIVAALACSEIRRHHMEESCRQFRSFEESLEPHVVEAIDVRGESLGRTTEDSLATWSGVPTAKSCIRIIGDLFPAPTGRGQASPLSLSEIEGTLQQDGSLAKTPRLTDAFAELSITCVEPFEKLTTLPFRNLDSFKRNQSHIGVIDHSISNEENSQRDGRIVGYLETSRQQMRLFEKVDSALTILGGYCGVRTTEANHDIDGKTGYSQ